MSGKANDRDIFQCRQTNQAFVKSIIASFNTSRNILFTFFLSEKYISAEQQLSCPFCGSRVIKKNGYFCSAKRETGCAFSIGQEICGKKISDAQALRLIEKGKTTLIKGFKSKAGKEFDAYLVADKKEKKVKFEFPKK